MTQEILIVDDMPANLEMLRGILSQEGYRVRAAINGKQALQLAAIKPPDLILMDINMPEMNGLEACQQLKATPLLNDIPVVFISANEDISAIDKAFQAGGVDYVTKPFRPREVLVRVKSQLSLQQLKNQKVRQQLFNSLFQLTAGIAHEINTPLGVSVTAATFINDAASNVSTALAENSLTAELLAQCMEHVREGTELIETNLQRVSLLVDRFRELAQDQREFSPNRFRIKDAVGMASSSFTHEFEESNVKLNLDGGELEFTMPQMLLVDLIKELIRNALHHAKQPDCRLMLALAFSLDNNTLILEFQDNGPGMADAALARLFEPFYTSKRSGKHCGLSACRIHNLVYFNLSGQIETSSGEGMGLKYRIQIPEQKPGT
ncbi:hybrid sensor histidine kinase/response regulator [Shewanella sp. JM162201]|uniref:histidine kinase n=1 Tax=Shewanella jiangmenensis TaxID=2837387 RepID=A0ABS5V0E3_9GAMM|nr:hybrid sensor histidine kinase/response regulator [Shewanella jiangmenensis]MBT1443231.1 hybrid sensor histidine kinase/response regulator [Shewanella jiangmenensis]